MKHRAIDSQSTNPEPEILLDVAELDVRYDEVIALEGVSIRVPKRSIVTIIGANGAGKSTLINTISGLMKYKAGSIAFQGKNLRERTPDEIVSMGISQVPEGRRVFGNLTVEENLLLGAYLNRNRPEVQRTKDEVFELFPRLAGRRTQVGGTLSGGEQQMLAIGRALMSNPSLLLMDEPSLGLAPLLVGEVFRKIDDIRETGTTILLVEQNSRMALRHADYGYVLETGRVVKEGPTQDLLDDDAVREAYLGLGATKPQGSF